MAPVQLPVYEPTGQFAAGEFAINLGGELLKVTRLAGCNRATLRARPLDCRVRLSGQPTAATLDLLSKTLSGNAGLSTFTLYDLDANHNVMSQLLLEEAFVRRIALPTLSAADGTTKAYLELDLVANKVTRSTPGGQLTPLAIGAEMTVGKFQVTADGVRFPAAAGFEGLDVEVEVVGNDGGVAPGKVLPVGAVFEVGTADGARARSWASSAEEGQVGQSVTVELLRSDLAAVLLTWQIDAVNPTGHPEPFAVGTPGRLHLPLAGGAVHLS